MNTYVNYLFEANLALILYLAFYMLLFRNETSFTSVRMILLAGIFISLVFPLLHFQNSPIPLPSISNLIPGLLLPEIGINAKAVASKNVSFSAMQIVHYVYWSGTLFFLCVFVMRLYKLAALIIASNPVKTKGVYVAESASHAGSFSFFNFVFIGQSSGLSEKDRERIIAHEAIHVLQCHSFDILLLNFLGVLFWFNPFLRVYKNIFIQIHEYEADARSVKHGEVNDYCNLLARVALLSADLRIANHFSNSLTLKRIQMMRKIKMSIRPWKMATLTAIVPAIFFVISCQEQLKTDATDVAKSVQEKSRSDEGVYSEVEETATPAEGMEKYYSFVSENLRYPKEAREKGIEGKVYVSFIVETDGSVSGVNVLKGVDELLDKEALRVIENSPTWLPGKNNGVAVRQRVVVPINFSLDEKKSLKKTGFLLTPLNPFQAMNKGEDQC